MHFAHKVQRPGNHIAHIEPHIESNLVVSAPCGMEFAPRLAYAGDEFPFDGHVDIFLGGIQRDFAAFEIAQYFTERFDDGARLILENYAALTEHAAVGNASLDIIAEKTPVEVDRCGIILDQFVCRLVEAALRDLESAAGNDLPYSLFLPSYTATAWYHKKLPPDLQGGDLQKAIAESVSSSGVWGSKRWI